MIPALAIPPHAYEMWRDHEWIPNLVDSKWEQARSVIFPPTKVWTDGEGLEFGLKLPENGPGWSYIKVRFSNLVYWQCSTRPANMYRLQIKLERSATVLLAYSDMTAQQALDTMQNSLKVK